MVASPRSDTSADRASAIRDGARELLERDGPDGLTIRRLVALLGVHPPAVYRHYADKRAVEDAVVSQAFREHGDVMRDALAAHPEDPLGAVFSAGRAWALDHPHLYRLMYARPLTELSAEEAEYAARPVREATAHDLAATRSAGAFSHGLVMLELDRRFPDGAELEEAWAFGTAALRAQISR